MPSPTTAPATAQANVGHSAITPLPTSAPITNINTAPGTNNPTTASDSPAAMRNTTQPAKSG